MLAQIVQTNLASFLNLDLLALGIVIATALILGVIVFLHDRVSITHQSFLLFLILTVIYSSLNYLQYKLPSEQAFLVLKLVLFVAIWHAFSLFQLFFVFPRPKVQFPMWHKAIVVPFTAIISLLALSPFTFRGVGSVVDGKIATIVNGPGIVIFGIAVILLIIAAILALGRTVLWGKGIERTQAGVVGIGTFLTFALIIGCNFIANVIFNNSSFLALTPLFFLPFIFAMFYATTKYHLLNMKVISTEFLTILLAIGMIIEVVFTTDPMVLIFRIILFALILGIGILLVRSVRREVEQRILLEEVTAQLKEANLKLEDLSRFKTQLLSLASHQIKSPLAAIKGFTTILLEGLYGPLDTKVKETLSKMKNAEDNLVNLINMLLDLRKVEEGRMDYQFTKVDLTKLIGHVMEEIEPLATAKSLEFTFDASSPSLYVSADAEKFKQVIQNLIDNSIKYTPKGFVKVALKEEGNTVIFSVHDSGLGINPELIPHLFEEFIREDRIRKEVMGTGLGLYIAKKIVDAHSGRIWAESKGADQGAAFYVALKKASV